MEEQLDKIKDLNDLQKRKISSLVFQKHYLSKINEANERLVPDKPQRKITLKSAAYSIIAASRLLQKPHFKKYQKLPSEFKAGELNQLLDDFRERILSHEDEISKLGHAMNEKLHTELKSAFD